MPRRRRGDEVRISGSGGEGGEKMAWRNQKGASNRASKILCDGFQAIQAMKKSKDFHCCAHSMVFSGVFYCSCSLLRSQVRIHLTLEDAKQLQADAGDGDSGIFWVAVCLKNWICKNSETSGKTMETPKNPSNPNGWSSSPTITPYPLLKPSRDLISKNS